MLLQLLLFYKKAEKKKRLQEIALKAPKKGEKRNPNI